MQDRKYAELEERALPSEIRDGPMRAEAQSRIHSIIEQMKDEGKALVLTGEEEKMLRSFRRFKLRMRKDGEVFTWQTRREEGVQLAEETAEIVHPAEGVEK